jgi:lipid II:glycine glycyltransferase (peptidoglycan interpeptide bridge formation enzyme)
MMNGIDYAVFSVDFVSRWRDAFAQYYQYERAGEFLVIPSLRGKKTYSYLPGLTYTDKRVDECSDLLSAVKGKEYTIRTLDPNKKVFKEFEPVTMRLDISHGNKEQIMKNFNATNRNQVRQAERFGVVTKIGDDPILLDHFYSLYTSTMHRVGSPPFGRGLFDVLKKFMDMEVIVAYVDNEPAAAVLMVYDESIAWSPYAAGIRKFSKFHANQLAYRDAIFRAIDREKTVFDFGRSPYTNTKNGTYWFKFKMGARPVGLAILCHKEENIYAKYSTISSLWKKLPKSVADFIGPTLRRYLAAS